MSGMMYGFFPASYFKGGLKKVDLSGNTRKHDNC